MATKGSLGVFIDSKMVYAAYLSGSQRNTCSVPIAGTPEDLDYDAKITDAIRSAQKQIAPMHSLTHLAIPGEFAMVRCFELPALPKKEEPVAIRFEAQKYVPFELKDLCFDYDTIPDAARKRIRVLFYAGKKNAIERLVSCAESAGLSAVSVEILSTSLARSFNQEIVKNSGAIYMLIRTGEDHSTEIIIAKNQTVLISRHVTFDEAPGSTQWNPTSFLAELRLSFDYFDDVFKGEAVSRVYVSAPNRDEMQRLTETIGRSFSMPVEAVSVGGGSPETAAGLAVAHGLALYDASLAPRSKKINIKPAGVIHVADATENKTALKDFAIKVTMVSAAVLVGSHFLFGQSVKKTHSEMQRLSVSFPASPTTPITTAKDVLVERRDLLNQRLAFLTETVDRRSFFTLKMNALAKNVPSAIRLTSFTYDDSVTDKGIPNLMMRIEGYALAQDSASAVPVISKFVSSLTADKDFKSGFALIKITSTKTTTAPSGAPAVRFELECSSSSRAALS